MIRTMLCAAATAFALLTISPLQVAHASKYETDETVSEALAAVGYEYYFQYCAACHGRRGHGDGPAASSLKVRPKDLTRIAARRDGEFPLVELAAFIDGRAVLGAHGTREMPVWGTPFSSSVGGGELGDEVVRGRLLALLEFLRTIQE